MSWTKALSMRNLHNQQGFSLTELAVVIAIFALLAALSAPVMSDYGPSYNSKKATREIISQMQLARIHSIKNRVTTVVVFYPESYTPTDQANSFLIFEDDNRDDVIDATDNNWIHDAGENVILQRTYMPRNVKLISATFTLNGSEADTETLSYGFDSQGLAARKKDSVIYVTGDVQLKNSKNQTRTISFNPFGKIKMSMGS